MKIFLSALILIWVLALISPGLAVAHSLAYAHDHHSALDHGLGDQIKKKCDLITHLLEQKVLCPHASAGGFMIGKECGGNPNGKTSLSGSGFSKDTVAESESPFVLTLSLQGVWVRVSSYSSLDADPSERPPSQRY